MMSRETQEALLPDQAASNLRVARTIRLDLLFAGGDSLKGFALALMIGIVSGTYSSIFNAAPLLVVWRRLQPMR